MQNVHHQIYVGLSDAAAAAAAAASAAAAAAASVIGKAVNHLSCIMANVAPVVSDRQRDEALGLGFSGLRVYCLFG